MNASTRQPGGIRTLEANDSAVDRRAGAPVAAHRTWVVVVSVVITALVALTSLFGLFTPWPYDQETENWVLQAWGQDVGNIVAAAVLIATAVGTRRGSIRARQMWIGTLFYFLYAYAVYAFAVHFSRLFAAYVAILGFVFWTLVAALSARVRPPASPVGRVRTFAASVLIGTGALFALLWLSELVPATFSGEPPRSIVTAGLVTNPIYVIDLAVVLPGMIVVGMAALRGREQGLSLVLSALTFSVLMGSSIIAASIFMLMTGDVSGVVPLLAVTAVAGLSLWAVVSCAHQMKPSGQEVT